jgi:hypothetical protein
MSGRKTFLLVVLLLITFVLGLNTSSKGISSLTMEEQGPVVGLTHDNNKIVLTVMGKSYDVEYEKLTPGAFLQQTKRLTGDAARYVQKIWRIFYAVFLY